MVKNITIALIAVSLLGFGIYLLFSGYNLYKKNKSLITEGIKLKGKVHSYYLDKGPDGNDKMPVIQYIDPETKEYKYFNSKYDKYKLFDAYNVNDEVEVLYLKIGSEIIVKINDEKQISNDSISRIFLGVIFSFTSIGILINVIF